LKSKAARRLHGLYAADARVERSSRLGLAVGFLFSLEMAANPGVSPFPFAFNRPVSEIVASLILGIPVLLYTLIGITWTVYETVASGTLPRWLKFVTLVLMVASVGIWSLMGAPRWWLQPDAIDPALQYALVSAQKDGLYLTLSAILVYIPAILYATYLVVRMVSMLGIAGASVVWWVGKSQSMERLSDLEEFLSEPLALTEGGPEWSLLDLEEDRLTALREWSACRRQVVQNRLIPTTLLLGFLGLLANTSLGERTVGWALRVLQSSGLAYSDWYGMLAHSGQRLLLVVLIFLPIAMLVDLLNEAYAMDFIAQACVLARHAKRPSPIIRTRAWWERLLRPE